MRLALFCHSLRSDWNHGNAHFLRGIVGELMDAGHEVRVFEPADAWSARHLAAEHGRQALDGYRTVYPRLSSTTYDATALDLEQTLDGVDLVLVHEWNDPDVVRRIGAWRRRHREARVLFHDTHHRSVTKPSELAAYDLAAYDGVLAFGACIRERYLAAGWARQVWTWHEAADTRVFRPMAQSKTTDVIWIGNWGDGERAAEIDEFLLRPIAELGASARVFGVRYPPDALARLAAAGVAYGGWLPNYRVPEAFAESRATVHVPRRPYVEALPGIPTIRPFEAMACGIPLVSAPWDDVEGLFRPGQDFLVARDGTEMARQLRLLLHEASAARALAGAGRAAILARHTCRHRVQELMTIAAGLGLSVRAGGVGAPA